MPSQGPRPTAAAMGNPDAFRHIPPNRHVAAPELPRDPPNTPPHRLQPKHRRHFLRRLHHVPPRFNPAEKPPPILPSSTLLSPQEGVQFSMSLRVQFYLSPDKDCDCIGEL